MTGRGNGTGGGVKVGGRGTGKGNGRVGRMTDREVDRQGGGQGREGNEDCPDCDYQSEKSRFCRLVERPAVSVGSSVT